MERKGKAARSNVETERWVICFFFFDEMRTSLILFHFGGLVACLLACLPLTLLTMAIMKMTTMELQARDTPRTRLRTHAADAERDSLTD
jgi:hypothetical protein